MGQSKSKDPFAFSNLLAFETPKVAVIKDGALFSVRLRVGFTLRIPVRLWLLRAAIAVAIFVYVIGVVLIKQQSYLQRETPVRHSIANEALKRCLAERLHFARLASAGCRVQRLKLYVLRGVHGRWQNDCAVLESTLPAVGRKRSVSTCYVWTSCEAIAIPLPSSIASFLSRPQAVSGLGANELLRHDARLANCACGTSFQLSTRECYAVRNAGVS